MDRDDRCSLVFRYESVLLAPRNCRLGALFRFLNVTVSLLFPAADDLGARLVTSFSLKTNLT